MVYHRYWPGLAPDAPSVIEVPEQPELPVAVGSESMQNTPAVTVLQPMVTSIGPVVAPAGTLVVIVVAETELMVAETPLNIKLLAKGVVKLLPVILTVVPIGPDDGVKETIVGDKISPSTFLRMGIVFSELLAVRRSGLPSPSRSPRKVKPQPLTKSTGGAKDEAEIVPKVAVFLNTDFLSVVVEFVIMSTLPSPSMSLATGLVPGPILTLLSKDPAVIPLVLMFRKAARTLVEATMMSGLLSPSMSDRITVWADGSAVKSTVGAREPELITPTVDIFLSTETVPLPELAATTSGFPSPSRSAMARP